MAPNIFSKETEDLIIEEVDLTEFTLVVGFRGHSFKVACVRDCIVVHEHPADRLVGFVRRGSDTSGAIWLEDKCVADYLVSQPGKYCITEIRDTFRVPEVEVETDPVLYLLDAAWAIKTGKAPMETV